MTRAHRLLAALNGLRSLGLEKTLRVPTLVIAGNQSSGKSSVVEAIAGVALPRAPGTCTRCPTEVRMSCDSCPHRTAIATANAIRRTLPPADSSWRCRIWLRFEHGAADQRQPETRFSTVYDRAHIAAHVTAAQAMLLNPKGAATAAATSAFMPLPSADGSTLGPSSALAALGDPSEYELRFTRNSVVLEIEGAEADLTIVDLPGIIQSHAEGPELVDLVHQMTRDAIKPENHTIVTTIAANDDPDNQAISLWARQVDPAGARQLAVLTKPDLVPAGMHDEWVQRVQLASANGPQRIHVVRNPGQDELDRDISPEAAREAEQAFFQRSPHWAPIAHRVGTPILRAALSSLLVEIIEQQLPDIQCRAREALRDVQRQLAALPPGPSAGSAPYELPVLLRRVAERLRDELQVGGEADAATYQRFELAYARLGTELGASMPAFYVNGRLFSALNRYDRYDDGGGGGGGDGSEGDSSGRNGSGPNDVDELDVAALRLEAQQAGKVPSAEQVWAAVDEPGPWLRAALAQRRLPPSFQTLDDVSQLLKSYRGPELPPFMPPHLLKKLITRFRGEWQQHAQECLEAVAGVVGAVNEGVVAAELGRYPKTAAAVRSALAAHLESVRADALERLANAVAVEHNNTSVQHLTAYNQYRKAFLAALKHAHMRMDEGSTDLLKQVPQLQGSQTAGADALLLALPSKEEDELQLMAACLAYYKVVFRRAHEVLPLTIKEALLNRLAQPDVLQRYLQEALLGQQPSAEAARELLHESEETTRRRAELADREGRLVQACRLLQQAAPALAPITALAAVPASTAEAAPTPTMELAPASTPAADTAAVLAEAPAAVPAAVQATASTAAVVG
ncbi:Interferon-induced GTP-binding protein MxB [Tetrabaena socialis]|uniref:Interferon-induced GTP-binding protein MxB n=1 Tax=Tetrabaena socialis TaxID=47790 RepID=A0A2J8A8T7_9CHLO|nr:Interferon-induced GTP-binding protein MxB [Tetrabaena socialis]|eukprot:PNH08937.1 Interferon-induced GTP-binding protein MxB [Tetrabaena socialis]